MRALFVSAFHLTGLDPSVNYSGELGEGKFGHEPQLKPCWTMLVISPLNAMWA